MSKLTQVHLHTSGKSKLRASVGAFQPSRDTPDFSVPHSCEGMCHCFFGTQAYAHTSPLWTRLDTTDIMVLLERRAHF